jgi:glutathione synthase/RimK-type ligase-like ATP-grasp enzyme
MILGVYFNEKNFQRLTKGKLEYKMNCLAEEAIKEEIQMLVFSPLKIDWMNKNVDGLIYNHISKKWEAAVYPFPNVIYDRATFLEKEKEIGYFVRERLNKEYKIPFVNSKSYFNKWETHEVLSYDKLVSKYLPDTIRYYHPCQIIDLLDKYTSVYIKDSAGKLGKNIFKLSKDNDELYIVSYQNIGNKYSFKLSLEEFHTKFIANKLLGRNIIIQQGIDIAVLNEHPFDIRILAQKKEVDMWEVVDKSIRVASPGSIVTNISSGGEVKNFNEVIPLIFRSSTSISSAIDALAVNVCEALEKKYGTLGELGIDVALDKNGNAWLLEVNGKPAKLCIYNSGNIELINRSCRNIARYSKSLFKQMNEREIISGGLENGGSKI